jgi:apolipoprotein N-acyltransferase
VLRPPIQSLLLAGLTGILLFASFPKLNQNYLAWLALVPLLLGTARARSFGRAFVLGLAGGLVQWMCLMNWIPFVLSNYGGLPVPAAWSLLAVLAAYLALYQAAACGITSYCMRRRAEHYLFLFPFVWVSLEAVRNYCLEDGFPWLLLGYSQTDWLSLIQIADFAGVFGVSFLVAAANAALAWAVIRRKPDWRSLGPLGACCLLVFACVAYGRVALPKWSDLPTDRQAALLQGNLAFEDAPEVLAWKFDQGYLRMADRLDIGTVDLLILPEAPAVRNFQSDVEYRRNMEALARRTSIGLVLNNVHFEDEAGASRYFNSGYFLRPDGTEAGRYDKIHLVPFGEYIPWSRVFSFLQSISRDVGAFSAGREFRVFELEGQRLNAIICFEAIFPQLARRFVVSGSRLIVNLTNDRWYGDSAAPYQHLEMSRWRAVENRRYLLRATNSGVSAIVDPAGRIVASTPLLSEAVCTGRFAFIEAQTFYSRHGDVFAGLCAIITLVAAGCCVARRRLSIPTGRGRAS